MTRDDPMLRNAIELVRECQTVMRESAIDPARAADCSARLDQTASKIDTGIGCCQESLAVWVETAAWCRLAAGLLRGQDVPESIHIPVGEDPADSSRWKKWRVP